MTNVEKKSSFKAFLSCFQIVALTYSGSWENEETNKCTCVIAKVKPMHW